MSPEIINKMPYNYVSDIWSFGTIIFELFTGAYPFTAASKDNLKVLLTKGDYKIK